MTDLESIRDRLELCAEDLTICSEDLPDNSEDMQLLMYAVWSIQAAIESLGYVRRS